MSIKYRNKGCYEGGKREKGAKRGASGRGRKCEKGKGGNGWGALRAWKGGGAESGMREGKSEGAAGKAEGRKG